LPGSKQFPQIWDKSAYSGEVCASIDQPGTFPWTDQLNIRFQKPDLPITADACCDNLIKGMPTPSARSDVLPSRPPETS